MAARRKNPMEYRTLGNVAYIPEYDGSAVRTPRREQGPQRKRKSHPQVRVRKAGAVAPFAVVGFFMVGVLTALLLFSYAQFVVASDEVISLRNELNTLKKENTTLSAQYEQVFDIACIQKAAGGEMVRPTGDQIMYIDLSEPDKVTVYGETAEGGLNGLLDGAKNVLSVVVEYFR